MAGRPLRLREVATEELESENSKLSALLSNCHCQMSRGSVKESSVLKEIEAPKLVGDGWEKISKDTPRFTWKLSEVEANLMINNCMCAMGNYYSLQKDLEIALKNFQRAVQLNPRYVALEDFENGKKKLPECTLC
ncbi:hypothetical protein M9H77_02184 [Catharanthus roseus]|uniref:Uncharacterized protein n=1 Tax=Catharanthus roseus TaxID=4058 RepID=A0ACC0C7W5_CATRO|nr:hypothetical protein M9H77_02184 [Catharanthus roseus]